MIRIPALAISIVLAAGPAAAEPLETEALAPPDPSVFGEGANLDALNWDVSRIAPARGRVGSSSPASPPADWSRTENKDGSSVVTVKRALPTEWDSKVGLDLSLARPQGAVPPLDALQGGQTESTGAAWATITAPSLNLPAGWDKATLDARVDPSADHRRLGTTLSKSVPLNDRLSVTLQNGAAVTHRGTHPGWLDSATQASAGAATDVYSADSSAKLNVLPSGTTIGVGASRSSTDDRWLRKFSTEQKLFGDISLTGSISETQDGPLDRSLTAGFKRNW